MAETTFQAVCELYDAYARGDLDALTGLIAEEAVWHDPGSSARAGVYAGVAAIGEHTVAISTLTDGTLANAVKAILDGGEYAAVVERVTGARRERLLDLDVCTVFRGVDGKLMEWWVLPFDPATWDAFWA
jgi:uncharacterized protein